MASTQIEHKFKLNQKVYLQTDPEQYERRIYYLLLCMDGSLMYGLRCGEGEPTDHYEEEISTKKNVLLGALPKPEEES